MHARNKIVGAISAAVGLVIALTATAVPASAAPPAPAQVTSTMSCASLEGVTVIAPSVSYSGVGLKAGETITVKVSPWATGDSIQFVAALGISLVIYGGPAPSYAFTSGASTVYTLQWSYRLANGTSSTTNRTWTFDCSTTSVPAASPTAPTAPDDDRDGVANTADSCSGTTLPDNVSRKVAGSYYANSSGTFVDGANRSAGITVVDAGGCSATQIAKKLGLSKNASRSGIPLSTLTSWANSH